jgi:hypothetical protein
MSIQGRFLSCQPISAIASGKYAAKTGFLPSSPKKGKRSFSSIFINRIFYPPFWDYIACAAK